MAVIICRFYATSDPDYTFKINTKCMIGLSASNKDKHVANSYHNMVILRDISFQNKDDEISFGSDLHFRYIDTCHKIRRNL